MLLLQPGEHPSPWQPRRNNFERDFCLFLVLDFLQFNSNAT